MVRRHRLSLQIIIVQFKVRWNAGRMKTKTLFAVMLGVVLLGAGLAWWWPGTTQATLPFPQNEPSEAVQPAETAPATGARPAGHTPSRTTASMAAAHQTASLRGAPGTLVQLRIVPADAGPDSVPRTVAIVREQIRHKQ
jgi:hypothetical protein